MSPFPSIPLQTERLLIRYLTDSDLQAIFDIRSDPEVMRYWSSPPITELAQAQEIITTSQEGYETGDFLQLGIEHKSDSALIGTCTLFAFHRPSRRAEMGYALGRPFWGQGYMNEALKRLVQYAFDELDLNRLEADIDPRNLASAKTLERLGFLKEGQLRERWIVNGEVSDSDIYGLLRNDWLKLYGRSKKFPATGSKFSSSTASGMPNPTRSPARTGKQKFPAAPSPHRNGVLWESAGRSPDFGV